MKKIVTLALLMSLMTLMSCADTVQPLLKEVDTTFKINGKPIHPKLVQEFEPWLSDGLPLTISVDVLAAQGTNEYFESNIEEEDGRYTYSASERASYSYKWLGRLNNGLHVIRTADWGGGSGVFSSLLFVKFERGKGLDGSLYGAGSPEPYDRILMTVVCNYSLTDGYSGKIKLKARENKVIVQKEDKERVLDFNGMGL